MRVIRFTYDSVQVEISIFVLLYFRMNGIYVFERFFNFEDSVRNRMIAALPELKKSKAPEQYDEYDMELYLLTKEEEYQAFKGYGGYSEKAIVFAIGTWQDDHIDELNEKKTIDGRKIAMQSRPELNALLNCMKSNNLISLQTYAAMSETASIYDKNKVPQIFFLSKYFYVAESDKVFLEVRRSYMDVAKALFGALTRLNCEWGEVSSLNLQYAALYMAYEGNLYCLRNKKPFLYTPESIITVCEHILLKRETRMVLGESFYLLLAEVYGDLLKNANSAYKYYIEACQDYSAYAYFKKGTYLLDVEGDYAGAQEYLVKSLLIYPNYYRAWHILGICFVNLEKWEEAVEAFGNLEVILRPRIKNNMLRPMEIEYLFKAMNQNGDILFFKIQDAIRAIEQYLAAEEIWEKIDKTQFMNMLYQNDGKETLIKGRLKRELNINRVYERLAELYRQIGDMDKSKEYERKDA